jgi:hypothetical protein
VAVVAAFSGWYLLLPAGSAICFVAISRYAGAEACADVGEIDGVLEGIGPR